MSIPSNQHNQAASFLNDLSTRYRRVVQVAYDHGIGDVVYHLYQMALRHNLGLVPYEDTEGHEHSLGISPQENLSQYLLRIRMKPDSGYVKIYLYTDAYEPYFPVSEEEVTSALGRTGRNRLEPATF